MIKRRILRALSILTGTVMTICLLAGCGKPGSEKAGSDVSAIDPETVFREEASPLDDLKAHAAGSGTSNGDTGADSVSIDYNCAGTANDQYYVVYSWYSEQTAEEIKEVCIFDPESGDSKVLKFPSEGDMWFSRTCLSPDGRLFGLVSSYDTEKEQYFWDICSWSVPETPEGELNTEWRQRVSYDQDFTPEAIASGSDYTAVLGKGEVRIFSNEDGREQKPISLSVEEGFYGGLCTNEQGQLLLAGSGSKGDSAWILDPESARAEKRELTAESFYNFENISSGRGEYDFYGAKDNGIYGFKLDGSEPVMIVDFLSSDLDLDYALSCAVLSPESILMICNRNEGTSAAVLLKKADPGSVANQKVLTLGCTYADSSLRSAVVRFNKSNEKYRIKLIVYPYDEDGNNTFQTEITAGNTPDMISVSRDMPMENYAAKGMFVDLEPMFRTDPVISRGQYLDNVLDAFRIRGRMYFVTPQFSLLGLMGREQDFGNTKGVTIRQLEKMIEERKLEYGSALGLVSRDEILDMVMYFALDQYISPEDHSCHFNDESFVDLLEFARRFPKSINYDKVDWNAFEANMRARKQLVREVYLSDFGTYMTEKYGYIGEEVTFMGYPGNGGNGPALTGELLLAISHSADDPDACWEFLRTFYLEEYQKEVKWDFPVSREALQAMASEALHPQTTTYTDENGETVTEPEKSMIWLNGKEIEIPVPRQEDIDEVMRIIESTGTRVSVDAKIAEIINEEAGAFFAGQKSAGETAEVIQNRVSVYLRESY